MGLTEVLHLPALPHTSYFSPSGVGEVQLAAKGSGVCLSGVGPGWEAPMEWGLLETASALVTCD
jgi:hypothetical protein